MVNLYDAFENAKSDGGFFDTWLYGSWDDAKENTWLILRNTPIISDFVKFSEARIDQREYKKNHGIVPGYNYHPWRLPSVDKQGALISSGFRSINFISDNIKRLYS